MKKTLASVWAAVAGAIRRFFNVRPALKRGALVVLLVLPFLFLAFAIHAPFLAGVWSLMLLMVFWGMGAERAALDWDPTFSLPPLSSFAFWQWQPHEAKRFRAVLAVCLATVSASIALAVLT